MNIVERNPLHQLLFTLLCGIYGWYWWFCLAREAVSVKDPEDKGTLEAILAILFPGVGFYLAEKKLAAACEEQGIPHKDNSIMYLVLGFLCLGVVDAYLMQKDLNEIAAANA